jgi:phosphoribosylformylglycinamidine synthase
MKAKRRWAVVQFPGSNCDHDVLAVWKSLSRENPEIEPVLHWHEDAIAKGQYQLIVLPGGFSYGDYLRAGAIAKLSEALRDLEEVIEAGSHVMGICNGFQILLETRLLPGYLQVNQSLRFISETTPLEIVSEAFPWFSKREVGQVVRFPIAHKFGNYQVSKMDQKEMRKVLSYVENPNGSFESTAGIYRILGKGSVFGLMPHPERAFFEDLRLVDARALWKNAVELLR